ncbi:pyocin knob domain-containing protein [uncultured Senegalimassilia sp.]|uniref:pyocin knob domain-containing protein n=1 Tax=uncultured Senegalimassilia sp. TaxID=1714350 RepID=UPI0025EA5C58|nr:pyocin knob domain-containing protein [uncultured Senegalimassilia sp.]
MLGDSVSRAMGNHGKSDLDDVITPGVYTVRPPDVANLPAFTNEYAILIVLASEKNVLVQVYVRSGAGKVFVRTKWSAGFSAWYRYDGAMVAQVSADQAQ